MPVMPEAMRRRLHPTVTTQSTDVTDHVWSGWVMQTATSGTTATITWDLGTDVGTDATWQAWVGQMSTGASWTIESRPRAEEYLVRQADRFRTRREAEARATALLREHLTPEQREMLATQKHFVVSVSTGRRYQIAEGQVRNVSELDAAGKPVRVFCVHPDDVPDADAMLAQKLLLETDEATFRRLANVTEIAA